MFLSLLLSFSNHCPTPCPHTSLPPTPCRGRPTPRSAARSVTKTPSLVLLCTWPLGQMQEQGQRRRRQHVTGREPQEQQAPQQEGRGRAQERPAQTKNSKAGQVMPCCEPLILDPRLLTFRCVLLDHASRARLQAMIRQRTNALGTQLRLGANLGSLLPPQRCPA